MVFGKIVVFDLKLTQNLKNHSKFWKLTQSFGEQFQGIEVAVTNKIADNLIRPLRSVMFAIQI